VGAISDSVPSNVAVIASVTRSVSGKRVAIPNPVARRSFACINSELVSERSQADIYIFLKAVICLCCVCQQTTTSVMMTSHGDKVRSSEAYDRVWRPTCNIFCKTVMYTEAKNHHRHASILAYV